MRVALYLRVSTSDKGQNPENQLRQLRDYYQAQKWELVKEYVDYDSGSKSRDGQQFNRMREDARRRHFDILLFWSLDRFSREGVYKTLSYLNELASYGVDFFSLTEQYLNSIGIFKDAIISILATIAQQESVRISERVRAGLARARVTGTRSGKNIGRPRIILNCDKVAELRDSGMSWPKIAKHLGCGQATAIGLYRRARPKWVPSPKPSHAALPLGADLRSLEYLEEAL